MTNDKGKHTPGPWKVGRLPLRLEVDENPIPLIYTHDGSLKIAQVRTSAPESGEREANARLIAAAPDLLAACKAALDFIYETQDNEGYPKPPQTLINAIAKAEGTEL